MSVLQDDQLGVADLLKCKLSYLQSENAWMSKQYGYLCQLIELQKQIIHCEDDSLGSIHQQITNVLSERREFLNATKNRTKIAQRQIQLDDFVPLIYSFQEKISRLQSDIKNRQSHLQTIELAKGHVGEDKKLDIKCINTYESSSRILDRIRKEINVLRNKKIMLQNQLLILSEKRDQESTVVSAKVESSSKVVQEHTISQVPDEQTSSFEKVALLIKKKRYQNNCLEQKVNKYKTLISQKKAASQKLRREVEGLQWNCLDGFVGACGFVEGGQVGDLSLVGASFTNNTSFSFDVSRFIKPNARFRLIQN